MKKLLLLFALLSFGFAHAQIENGRYSYKAGERRQIIEITDTEVRSSSKSRALQVYTITERKEVGKAEQIICDIGNGEKLVITQSKNGKGLFMFKWNVSLKNPISDLRYWQMKKKSGNQLTKALSQTKTNW